MHTDESEIKEDQLKIQRKNLRNILGFRPRKIAIYRSALLHRSVTDKPEDNNERLEYLGDAIIGAVVAHYLFKLYPYKDEGFLTDMRSKMVNRKQLNNIAIKIGLREVTLFNQDDISLRTSQIFGNTLEALVGAVFLDKGYNKTEKWIIKHIIEPYLFLDELEEEDINLKNRLYGWVSKNGKNLTFETISVTMEGRRKLFTIGAVIDEQLIAKGEGFNKKTASKAAAQKAIEILKIE